MASIITNIVVLIVVFIFLKVQNFATETNLIAKPYI